MKPLLLLAPIFLFVLPSTSLFILLPLYIYPNITAHAWDPFFTVIEKYTSVHWQVIVNRDSGPGALTSAGYPDDSNYITDIARLNSYPNVQTLGYVHTSYGSAPYSQLTHNISVYAQWASYSPSNITIDGIFFDETPNGNTAANLAYMHNASTYASETVPTDITPIVFNVGQLASASQYFEWANTVVQFENSYANYQNYTTIKSIPASTRPQTAIIVHDTPANAPITSLVHTEAYYKIQSTYFTTDCCYNHVDPTFLNAFVAGVAAG